MSHARVAYVSGGTVGAGHLVRGLAVGRGLTRRGFQGIYRMFGPALPYAVAQRPEYTTIPMAERELRDPTRAPASALATALRDFRPNLLVVDMFWAPLHHILPLADCEAWLLIRTCPRVWLTGPQDMPFNGAQYARIIAIEPVRHAAIRERIDPIVVCNPDECRPHDALRERLRIAPNRPLVALMHAGLAGEVWQLEHDPNDEPAVFDLFAEDALFPLAEWLPGADRIIAAAGYNSFWEARWLGYAERTQFTPLPRQIDDQAWRVANCSRYAMKENGADTLAGWITSG